MQVAVPNRPYGLCGRKAALKKKKRNFSELRSCGRPGLPVPKVLYGLCGLKATLKKKKRNFSELRSCGCP